MFCTNCGKELSETAKFCTGCGTKVEAAPVVEAVSAVEAAPVSETILTEEKLTMAESTLEESAKKEKKEKKAKKEKVKKEKGKKSAGKVVAIIIVLVVLLGGAGVGWFFYGDTLLSQMNMKKAEECFASDEMEDALEYYEKALERDETLTDAYLKINEIYVKDGKYEDAIAIITNGMDTIEAAGDYAILQQALKRTYEEARAHLDADTTFALLEDIKEYFSEDTYNDEKGLLYLYKSSEKIVERDFLGALLVIEEGEADVVNYTFDAQKAYIYEQYADFYLENDNYDSALAVLNEGYDATGAESLLLKMKIAYKACAQSALETGNYSYAHTLLYECYDKTGDETLLDNIANVYLANAEYFLEDGDFEGALTVLDSGISDLDAEVLKEKKEAILENVYVYSETVYLNDVICALLTYAQDGSVLANYQFNENGEITSYTAYDGEGNILEEGYLSENQYSEYVYGGEGVLRTVATYDGEKNLLSEISYEYDKNGNMISFVNISVAQGQPISTGEYVYDEKGYLLSEKIVLVQENSEYLYEYAYDEEDRLISYKETYDGVVALWEGYEYNEKGLKVANITYDSYGNLMSTSTFAYDESNESILQNIVYDAAGNMTDYSEYSYDDNGNLLFSAFCSYDLDGNVTWDSASYYEYNEMGDTILEVHSSNSEDTNSENTYEYDYDENGNKIAMRTYLNGEFTVAYKYAFDYFGNMIEEHVYGSDGTFDNRYTYEYVYEYAE